MKNIRFQFAALICSTVLLLALVSSVTASDFREQMAAWQSGGIPVEQAAPNPRSPSDRSALPRAAQQSAVAPAVWQQAAEPALEQEYCSGGADPYSDHGYASPVGDCACGPACGARCGSCYGGCNTMVWARFEAILWWREGRELPPLVTTDPAAEPFATAGILPNAEILFGNGYEKSDLSAGGRFDIGTWFDPRQCYGVGWRFFGLGGDGLSFRLSSVDNPVIAIPFSTINPAANDALVLSYPGEREGEVNISGNAETFGNDIYGRFLLCRNGISRFDFITGYHFSRVNDGVTIQSQFTVVNPADVNFGTVTTTFDQFQSENEFHGGILGLMWERDCGCLTTQLMGRMSLGGIHQRMVINGSNTIAAPGQAPVVTQEGVFTGPSNIGEFEQTEFTAVTEAGATVAYRVGRCTQLTLGYTFILWHNIQRPGDAIDTTVDLGPNPTRPAFNFATNNYWVQGLNLGFEFKF